MKLYVCHKEVMASQITEIEDGENQQVTAICEDGTVVSSFVGKGIFARYVPVVGDYLVEYPGDGYRSISPKIAFEDGYTEKTA